MSIANVLTVSFEPPVFDWKFFMLILGLVSRWSLCQIFLWKKYEMAEDYRKASGISRTRRSASLS
jgi:hypothetical protein